MVESFNVLHYHTLQNIGCGKDCHGYAYALERSTMVDIYHVLVWICHDRRLPSTPSLMGIEFILNACTWTLHILFSICDKV